MSTLHAPAAVFPFQTPARVGTYSLPNAPHEHLDPETTAELNAWTDDHETLPTPEEVDRMAVEHRGVDFGDFIDRLSAPQFPEVATWSDDHLIVALDMADRRDAGLNLHAVGNVPDRHDAFIAEVSAEIVRRLDSRNAQPARVAA